MCGLDGVTNFVRSKHFSDIMIIIIIIKTFQDYFIISSEKLSFGRFSNSDSVYFAEVERFSNWCRDNSLDLNVKEMPINFRKVPTVIPDLFTNGVKVQKVTEYKYR